MNKQQTSGPTRLAAVALLGLVVAMTGSRVADARQATMPSASQLLAGRLAHMARRLVRGQEVSAEALEGALILAETAGELDTGDVEHQRLILEAANLLERRDVANRAVRRIIELEPSNTAAQLTRLNTALDDFQQVETRTGAYEDLLSDRNRVRLHPSVSSRLATDLALVRQREGNTEEFARWIAEAMTLDASNPVAAAVAVEFFDQSSEDDPIGRAELLINLVMTNPADHLAQVALGRLLLEQGAYAAAARTYDLAVSSRAAAGLPAWLELEIDRAISYWGSGSAEAALRRVERIERLIAEAEAAQPGAEANAGAGGDAGAALDVPPAAPPTPDAGPVTHPSLLAIRAALAPQTDNPDAASIMRDEVVRGCEAHIADASEDDLERASRLLEAAWIAVWLLEDADRARAWLDQAREIQPLTETADARFAGWLALRGGDPAEAVVLMQRVAETDDAAKLGVALALEEQSNLREAARSLLDVARRRAGTLIGVWAADRLAAILNQRVPLTDTAARLDGLVSAIPTSVDRYPEDARMVLSLSIRPTKRVFAPFEPITVEIELTNRSPRALAIGPDGPVRPHLLLYPSVTAVTGERAPPAHEVVVDLSRKLRIEPRESMTIQVELRRNCLDSVIGDRPLTGALIQVEGIVNFVLQPDGRIAPGLLGVRAVSEGFRVRGVTVDDSWYTTALTVAREPRSIDDVLMLVLLAHAGLRDPAPSGLSVDEIARRVAEGFGRIDPVEQAWVLSVLPTDPQMERVRAAARPIDHPLVRLAYLVFQVQEPTDPMLDAAVRSEGPRLRRMAEIIRQLNQPVDASAEEPAAVDQPDDAADDGGAPADTIDDSGGR